MSVHIFHLYYPLYAVNALKNPQALDDAFNLDIYEFVSLI